MKTYSGFLHETKDEWTTVDWITPKPIIAALGAESFFDLDPCSSLHQPWITARKTFTVEQDGLKQDWWGNVWLNPPYGKMTIVWIQCLIAQLKAGNITGGVSLLFARTETILWQKHIFPTADGFVFIKHRVAFARPDGTYPDKGAAGAPSVLIAWGERNRTKLIEVVEAGLIPGVFLNGALSYRKQPTIGGQYERYRV